jgi:type IV pilus assembly protein PilB
MSPRAPKSQRLRAVPEADEEPQVVRAPPDRSSAEGDAEGGERQAPRGGARGQGTGGAVRAPAERGAVRAPPEEGARRSGTGREQAPAREAAPRGDGPARGESPPQREPPPRVREPPPRVREPPPRVREPVVEIDDEPSTVRMPDDDAPLSDEVGGRGAPRAAPQARAEPARGDVRATGAREPEVRMQGASAEHDARIDAEPADEPEAGMGLDAADVYLDAAGEDGDAAPVIELDTGREVEIEIDGGPDGAGSAAQPASEEAFPADGAGGGLGVVADEPASGGEPAAGAAAHEPGTDVAGQAPGAVGEPQGRAAREARDRVQVGAQTHEFPTESARTWAGVTPPSQRGSSSRFLTDVIVDMELVTREVMDTAVEMARNQGSAPERVLVDQGTLSPDGLARALAERYGLDHIDLSVFPVDPAAVSLVTSQAAKRYQAVPVAYVDKRTLLVAMADPANVLAVDDIAIMTGCEVRVAVASPQDVADLIARMDRLDAVVTEPEGGTEEEQADTGEVVNLRENADDAPVVKLVNQVVAQAVEQGASDVHLAPTEKDLRVRFRIDGVLRDVTTVPRRMAPGVVSRVKIMAELDIAERRLPQDGRVGLTVDGRHVDLRIVTLPSAKGEAVIMRILDKESVVMDFDKLGMSPDDRERFEHAFHLSHGCVLVTGPTGSGKTTTLYAALTALNTKERNIITVEDPVEYQMEGITQVQVNAKVGLTFAVGLRTMVRADPDVIMVGEIRDRETAQIAVESALTGHMVLSTLHTNDAPSAIHRLIEMDIEPFLVASAIESVLAQRLARTLCPHCKKRAIIPADALRANGYNAQVDMEAYEPVGCPRCGGTGYRGRIALYEVMTMSREIRELALERRSADEIREVAIGQGMRRMRDDGLEKVRAGLTSMAEVARVIGSGS